MATQRASKPRYAILGDLLQAGIERGDYPNEDDAIEAAHAQGITWILHYG